MQDNIDMVRILASKDADLFALSEGYTPSTCARLAGHDEICEWLVPRMEQARTQDPKIWQKARLAQLRREAADLAAQLDGSLAAAKALIDAGISVKQVAALGHVPLHFACIQGNLALVKQLLEKGADLFAMSHGEAPIACARHAGNRRSASCWFVS
jgi:ankyrin repeat protein